jgi:conserved hypothetical protein TIGR00268
MTQRTMFGLEPLLALLRPLTGAVAAYSGGVDSTLLAVAAHTALGPRALAVTVRSAFTAPGDLDLALDKARALGLNHRVLDLDVWAVPGLSANGPDRCYLCKRAVLTPLAALAAQGVALLEGTNADDDPARPGRRAVAELGALSPLAEAGLDKAAVRALSRDLGLPGWDAPSNSCLATRIPTGTPLTPAALERVDRLETVARGLGLSALRCRDRGETLVLEIPPDQLPLARNNENTLVEAARAAGFSGLTIKERTSA